MIDNPLVKAMAARARMRFEACYVARMRLARFIAGGYRAQHELKRMARERQALQIQTRMQMAQAVASGDLLAIPARLASLCNILVHENYRRLFQH